MADDSVKFAVRSNESSRRTWTLTSLVVRIAHALGLHREMFGGKYTSPYPPFERELRRRLWWQICTLDMHASTDRGSDPIIITKSFSTQLPLNINDEDLIPDDHRDVQSRQEYTDVTLSLVIHEVFDIERRLNYVLAGESDRSQEGTDEPWDQRREWVDVRQQRIKDKYLRHCNITIPAQRYTMLVADVMIATMWLWAYRPLQRRRDSQNLFTLSRTWILDISVDVMEKAVQIPVDSCSRPFRWISTIWVQWHALAVMVAELCVQIEGPSVERAWSILDLVFEETARHVADSDKGRLWRPIKKLMKKAQTVRKKYLEDATSNSVSLPFEGALRLANRFVPSSITQISDLEVMEIETGPQVLGDIPEFVQQRQQSLQRSEPIPANRVPRVSTQPSEQMDYDCYLDQMAWTNWENFMNDLQVSGGVLTGQENSIPPSFNTW